MAPARFIRTGQNTLQRWVDDNLRAAVGLGDPIAGGQHAQTGGLPRREDGMNPPRFSWLSISACVALGLAGALPAAAQGPGFAPAAVGTKIADGEAYATVVVLKHQSNAADNGRMLLAYEANNFDGIPIWESTDQGSSWHFVTNAKDPMVTDRPRCEMHWQPHLTEMPRTQHGIAAGTVLLSASTLCQQPPPGRGNERMFLRLFTSGDFGRSWNYVSTYAEAPGAEPVWEPQLLILDDGTFVEFYSDEMHKREGYNQLLGHKVSKDGGKTWGPLVFDAANPGGVERPGMVIIDRLPDGRYVYNYEDVEGPVHMQVHLKFSKDGLHWGDPEDRGTPVQTPSGRYPESTPNVFWFPVGGPKGIIAVTSRSLNGPGRDDNGNTIFWNNNLGVGPWWEAPTPVQKLGNSRAGWTQALVRLPDGQFLHVTSSASADPARTRNSTANEILFKVGPINFNRYEAESAGQKGSAIMRDGSMSNGAKSRLGAKDVGKLSFPVHVASAGRYELTVEFTGIGFDATPRLSVNGTLVAGSVTTAPVNPARTARRAVDLGTRGAGERKLLRVTAQLRAGDNAIEVLGGEYALDVDYLEVTPAGS